MSSEAMQYGTGTVRTAKWLGRIVLVALFAMAVFMSASSAVQAQDGVSVHTPYTGLSATPGESLRYPITIVNDTDQLQHIEVWIEGLEEGWESLLIANGRSLNQMSLLPNDSRSETNLDIDVPLEVEQGEYTFYLVAAYGDDEHRLPITIDVVEEGTFATELTTDQPNMQGHADSEFNFSTTLSNMTADEQHYGLVADAPRGWDVRFSAGNQDVTSVNIEAGENQTIGVAITPPPNVAEGEYTIPIGAGSGSSSDTLDLEVVVTGQYDVDLATPDERVSFEATAGRDVTVELIVTNTGTATLRDLSLDSIAPSGWEVEYEPNAIDVLEAGEQTTVRATISPDQGGIAGDYIVSMNLEAPEVVDSIQFRVELTTPVLWGWIGIAIIVAVIGGVLYLFRKYGRR